MRELEELPFASLLCTLLMGYGIEQFDISFRYRHEVATRIWITVNFEFGGKRFDVDGSTPAIVKRRIIERVEQIVIEQKSHGV